MSSTLIIATPGIPPTSGGDALTRITHALSVVSDLLAVGPAAVWVAVLAISLIGYLLRKYLMILVWDPRHIYAAVKAGCNAFSHVLGCKGGSVVLAYPPPGVGDSPHTSDFEKRFTSLLLSADEITLVGIGLSIVRKGPVWAKVRDRLAAHRRRRAPRGETGPASESGTPSTTRGKLVDLVNHIFRWPRGEVSTKPVKLNICFANVFAPDVIMRFVEERMDGNRWQFDRNHVASTIKQCRDDLTRDGVFHETDKCDLRLFSNQPTIGAMRLRKGAKEWLFFFIYPYRELGNEGPVFETSASGDAVGVFLNRHIERVVEDAVPFRKYATQLRDPGKLNGIDNDEGYGCYAVFLIPPPTTTMYSMLSPVLGYDCGEGKIVAQVGEAATRFHKHVGHAGNYGLHVTIAHGLWLSNSAKDRLFGLVRAIAKDLPKPVLRYNGTMRRDVNRKTLAIELQDLVGSCVVLHTEIVCHIYPLALTTEYMIRHDEAIPQFSRRRKLMAGRYGVENVLDEFKLYATVLTRDIGNGPDSEKLENDLSEYCLPIVETEFPEVAIMQSIAGKGDEPPRWKRIESVHFDSEPLRARSFDGSPRTFD